MRLNGRRGLSGSRLILFCLRMFSHIDGWPDPAVFRTMRRETQRWAEDRALPYPNGCHPGLKGYFAKRKTSS